MTWNLSEREIPYEQLRQFLGGHFQILTELLLRASWEPQSTIDDFARQGRRAVGCVQIYEESLCDFLTDRYAQECKKTLKGHERRYLTTSKPRPPEAGPEHRSMNLPWSITQIDADSVRRNPRVGK